MDKKKDVRFVRIHGRVVPIKIKGGLYQPNPGSAIDTFRKKVRKANIAGLKVGALAGLGAGALLFKSAPAAVALAAYGGVLGSVINSNMESNKQAKKLLATFGKPNKQNMLRAYAVSFGKAQKFKKAG